MNITLKHIVLGTLFTCSLVMGQDKKTKKADTNFDNYAYADAIDSYENLVKKGYTSEEIYKNLGNANYLNANYEKAADWYSKLFTLENATIDPEYIYRYAQTLKSLKKYEQSDFWMQKFEKEKTNDLRAQKFNESTDYLLKIKENSGRYTIKNSTLNSTASDFAPSFRGEELIFSTARDTGITTRAIHQWNKKSFLNLYSTTVSNDGTLDTPKKLSKILNNKTHESSTAFTKDGKTIYFTRNNSKNGNFSRDTKGISRLKIYKASLDNDEWADIIELPFNSDEYSVAHPTLSKDEKLLYFASDMPGTLGASDIFVVAINDDGTYGSPKNLGPKINTESRETFPYITQNNILYFASDGHPGLGGLDIFATPINEELAPIQNVGMPVNSEKDDFSFIINENTKVGYFASNRSGGIGSDDIYSFRENTPLDFTCHIKVAGIVKDKKTGALLPNANIVILDKQGETIAKTISNSKGEFNTDGYCKNETFKIIASLHDYNDGDTTFTVVDAKNVSDVEILLASNIQEASIGTDLAQSLNLEPIYFDFDKSFIRAHSKVVMEKVVAYMKQYPEAKIDVRSHTDARGNDNYNLALSDKRAKATIKYLISQGIDASRISGKGYGEKQLINNCDNSSNCSQEQHQLNRRSEFIVIK